MADNTQALFSGGINIALKISKHSYEETVRFYRDVLRMSPEERPMDHPTVSRTHRVVFGPNILWLDCVDNYAHSETWLELNTQDVEAATRYLAKSGTRTCDDIEQVPDGMHWIMDPAGTVFILKEGEPGSSSIEQEASESV